MRGGCNSDVKTGLGRERNPKFMCGGKTDNRGMCFMRFRKIYNRKRMKQHLPVQGSVIRYMRKPRVWKTMF